MRKSIREEEEEEFIQNRTRAGARFLTRRDQHEGEVWELWCVCTRMSRRSRRSRRTKIEVAVCAALLEKWVFY